MLPEANSTRSPTGVVTSKRAFEEDEDNQNASLKTKRIKSLDRTATFSSNPASKSSAPRVSGKKKGKPVCVRDDDHDVIKPATTKSHKKLTNKNEVAGEKRLRRFRETAPGGKYQDIHNRAMKQRMLALERIRSGTEECPQETVKVAGTTGNIYTVQITKIPNCDCPHASKGNQCKHIIYVMAKVLKAPDNLQYQLALLSSELREILEHAPPILTADNTSVDGKRKPVEGDCPICCCEFESSDEIVWCKAACGNNVHNECFGQWAATRKGAGAVTCPFCRTPWVGDEDMLKSVIKCGQKNSEGYVNVAPELGMSGQRDYSTYHPFWVRSQQRAGVDVGDWEDLRGV